MKCNLVVLRDAWLLPVFAIIVGSVIHRAQAADLPTFNELAGLIVAHRASISNGEFVVKNEVSFATGPLAGTSRSETITVYLDGPDRLRESSLRDFGDIGPAGEKPVKDFVSSVARVGDTVYEFSTADFGNGLVTPPEVLKLGSRTAGCITDPRLVGLDAESYRNLCRLNLNNVLFAGKYDERTVSGTREVDGEECFEVVSIRGDRENPEWKQVMLVAPNRDYNVLRIELTGDTIDNSLEVELQDVPDYGWFPQKLSLRQSVDEQLKKLSTTTISVTNLNKGVDDQVFTLQGMGAKNDSRVYDHRQAGGTVVMRLTDDGLVPWTSPKKKIDLNQFPNKRSGFRTWMILLNAVIVAGIGIALIIRAFRRPKGAEH